MSDLVKKLHEYAEWSKVQDWAYGEDGPRAVINGPPSDHELSTVEKRFGKLPASYLQALETFGLSEFSHEWNVTRMLPPAEIVEYYEIVQGAMDFSRGIRKLVLKEDGIDFYRYIPIIAGRGVDGIFALLSLDDGKVMYWDADQSGYVKDIFENTEAFLTVAIDRAMKSHPMRLT